MPWLRGAILRANPAAEASSPGPRGLLRRVLPWLEAAAGLALIAAGPLRDQWRDGRSEVGLMQWIAAVAGTLLVVDALIRRWDGADRGLLSHLSEVTATGRLAFASLALALVAIQLFAFREYRVDDAYITFRYARNLAETGVVTWNPGESPVEGYSNFLWMLLAAGAIKASADPLLVARAVSVLALLLAAFMVRRLATLVGASTRAARLSVLAFLAIPAFVFWGMSGLETASVVALSLGFIVMTARDAERERRPWRSALVAAALVLSRPEAPLFLTLTLLPLVFTRDARARRTAFGIAAITALLVSPYLGWKWATFGSWIPNSVVAKAGALRGLPIVTQAYLFAFPFLLLAVGRAARGSTRIEQQIWLAFVGLSLAGMHVATQVAHQLRFFLPVLAGVCVVIGPALEWLATAGVPLERRRAAFAGVAAAFLVFALAPVIEARMYARLESEGLAAAHERIGRALSVTYGGEGLLAASDCGVIPFESRMRTIDLWGLNDARIARAGLDPLAVMAERPDVVILHSLNPEVFQPRERYDRTMHAALARDPELLLRGRWPFSGYCLWVWSRRALVDPAPTAGAFSSAEHATGAPARRGAP